MKASSAGPGRSIPGHSWETLDGAAAGIGFEGFGWDMALGSLASRGPEVPFPAEAIQSLRKPPKNKLAVELDS